MPGVEAVVKVPVDVTIDEGRSPLQRTDCGRPALEEKDCGGTEVGGGLHATVKVVVKAASEEGTTPDHGTHVAGNTVEADDCGGKDTVAAEGDEAGSSSNMVKRVKHMGRRRKVAVVRLSPYTTPSRRRVGVGRR